MAEQKFKSFTIRLTPEEHRRVKVLAAELGTTIKNLLLHCIDRLEAEREGMPTSKRHRAIRQKLLEDPDVEQVIIKKDGQVHVKTHEERGDNGPVPWWQYQGQVEDVAKDLAIKE